jgi:hypothetical protein
MDQYKGGKGSDRQHWLSLWSNDEVVVDRKARYGEPIILGKPFVSLFGGIQPAMLRELGGAMEDGLMDRFLFAYPAARHIRFSEKEISEEAELIYASLYRRLSYLTLAQDDYGDPNPKAVKLTFEARRRFAQAVDTLGAEIMEPGFPTRLEGVWSKLRGYLARLALLLASCRCIRENLPEQVELEDIEAACLLLGYFKAHAKRVYAELREADPLDILAGELKDFVEEEGGEWIGRPTDLHEELRYREAEELPENPEWLSKRVFAVASHSAGLDARKGWKRIDGKSARVLILKLKSTVDTVVTVDAKPPTDNSNNGIYGNNSKSEENPTPERSWCHHEKARVDCWLCNKEHPERKRLLGESERRPVGEDW